MREQILEFFTNGKITAASAGYTVASGAASFADAITGGLAIIATASGIVVAWVTIGAHITKMRREAREHELKVQKLALEIDRLKGADDGE